MRETIACRFLDQSTPKNLRYGFDVEVEAFPLFSKDELTAHVVDLQQVLLRIKEGHRQAALFVFALARRTSRLNDLLAKRWSFSPDVNLNR